MGKKGKLFVVSAPSGSGKTTLCEKLIRSLPGKRKLVNSVSATTRSPRKRERDGVDYFFISRPAFIKRRNRRQFLEWAVVLGNLYGTPREFVQRHTAEGDDVLLNIDVQGALKVKRLVCSKRSYNAVFIFILPPTFQELERRLKKRSTENSREITRRLQLAKKEMSNKFIREYDYVVLNDTIGKSIEKLKEIITYERGR